jgi:hypothetical protein
MAPLTPSSVYEDDVTSVARDIELGIMRTSGTTGEAIDRMKNPDMLPAASQMHLEELQAAQRAQVFQTLEEDAEAADEVIGSGERGMRINRSLEGTTTNGRAKVGGGVGSVELRPDVLVGLSDEQKKGNAANTVQHEKSHAVDQKLMGTVFAYGEITSFDLHEMVSEEAGSTEESGNPNELRDDAPPDYREAHSKGKELQSWGVGRTQYQKRIAEGDTQGLQEDILQGGLDRGRITPADIVRNIGIYRNDTYAKAALAVLTNPQAKTAKGTYVPSLN